ncbi:oxidoreductase, zinc-binding dehydrogenase family superfamily [Talaromyces islandicus]|uniref:Oxidoreductase, zinc-binding dehydrogenase family superfamily n=1 Tax=Talaromyces islandicus TaxID=28573 RepID=A0A0U1M2B7_TALIS|nr:oxidoreductase, zinc-binding dehydrogenase family superfamily [Talaromyces islandicus]
MEAPQNQAAWLAKANTPLQVGKAPLPSAGPGELVVKNAAIAINPLDCHMQDSGVFIQQHAINLISGRPEDAAFALYTVISVDKAAILPRGISFSEGVVVPFAFEAAVCALSVQVPGIAIPGIPTPALGLPYPSLQRPVPPSAKTLVIYGGSSSVGSMATQLATAAGVNVISIVGAHSFELSKRCGASQVIDRQVPSIVDKVVEAIDIAGRDEFVGIFDAISTPETYAHDLAILARRGGGHLACTHPPPNETPANVKAGMIFGVNDVVTPAWRDFVTPALRDGKLQCLPQPVIVGKGLQHIQDALDKCRAGVSATKLVVEL